MAFCSQFARQNIIFGINLLVEKQENNKSGLEKDAILETFYVSFFFGERFLLYFGLKKKKIEHDRK